MRFRMADRAHRKLRLRRGSSQGSIPKARVMKIAKKGPGGCAWGEVRMPDR